MKHAKTAVITGAGSGIGLAAALEFAAHGWNVGLIGRGRTALDDAERRVEAAGGRAHVVLADVSDAAALKAAAAELETVLGPIDAWVNNAAIGFYGKFTDVPEDAFRRVLDVNLLGTVNGTRTALALMRPRNAGTIVQILSAISYRGVPLQTAYSTAKFGLRGFTEALRAELFSEGSAIHVTMVHPPSVNTPFYSHAGSVMQEAPRPPPPVYQPELVGEAVYLAATSKRREWKVTGMSLGTSIGNKLAPGLLDRLSGAFGLAAQKTTRQNAVAMRDPNTFKASTKALGTHGPFDSESFSTSVQWFLDKNPAALALTLGLLALGSLAAIRRRG